MRVRAVSVPLLLLAVCLGCSSGGDDVPDGGDADVDRPADAPPVLPDAAADVGDTGAESADAPEPPAFAIAWSLEYAPAGGKVTCQDAGTPWVALDARNLASNVVLSERFACTAGQAVSQPLPAGSYEIMLSLLDGKQRPVSSILRGPFATGAAGVTPLDLIIFRVVAWDISWILSREGRPVTCTEVGGRLVRLTTQFASEAPEQFTFPCADGSGISQAIRIGEYTWESRLEGDGGSPLSVTSVQPKRVTPDQQAAVDVVFTVR